MAESKDSKSKPKSESKPKSVKLKAPAFADSIVNLPRGYAPIQFDEKGEASVSREVADELLASYPQRVIEA